MRNDQTTHGSNPSRGLAMYVKSCHKVCSVEMLSTNKLEALIVGVVDKRTDKCIKIVLMYKPPSCGLNEFKILVDTLKPQSAENLVVIGDFNFDVSRNQNKEFILFMESSFPKLKMLGTAHTTRGNTLLDLCFTNCERASAAIVTCVWSYHHSLVASIS